MERHFFFFVASVVGETVNAVAGGGLITFPLLTLVALPVTADTTSAVALFFGIQPLFGARAAN